MDNLTNPMSNKEIELIAKSLHTKTSPRPDGFTGEFSRHLRKT